MATSGNVDGNLNRNEIIEGSLRLLGQLAEGEQVSAQQITDGQTSLNRMVKAWIAQGLHLWKYAEGTLFLVKSQSSYQFGGTNTDNATENFTRTALAVAGVATDLTITVDSSTGCLNGDFIGIELDDKTIQWTTIDGAPAGNVITITDALTGAAAIDNVVYCYTTKVLRPEIITDARRRELDNQETPISGVSRQEYFDQPNKDVEGTATQYYYDKQLTFGTIFIWPTPDSSLDQLTFTFQKPFEVFDSAADDADFPQEWMDALTFNLAVRMSPEYGVSMEDRGWLKQEATQLLDEMLQYDREPSSIYLQPNIRGFDDDSD